MNRNLPENIDDFFLDNLQHYDEEPDENTWRKIEQQLPVKKQFATIKYLSVAAAIFICISFPYLLSDPFNKTKNVNVKNTSYQITNIQQASADITTAKGNENNREIQTIKKDGDLILSLHHQLSGIDVTTFDKQKFEIDNIGNRQALNSYHLNRNAGLLPFITFQNNIKDSNNLLNKTALYKDEVKSIKLPNQHHFTIIPFFSFDHISGRFIEQYEFDNDDKDVYGAREKPDISFTGGALLAYQLNKKISLLSGFSMSASALSISPTAVKALKDGSGIYKFKLATSYGFAEISKSGITPAAGDSLLISSAEMKFKYITFPVLLSYNIITKKIMLSVHTGIALNRITSDKVIADYEVQDNEETETIKRIEGVRKSFFTVNTGIEARYNFSRRFDIGVSPELRYGINSINKGTPIKTFPVNYGLALNMHIHL